MSNNKLYDDLYNFFINVNKVRTDLMKKENPMQTYELLNENEPKENIIRKGMCQFEDLIKQFKRMNKKPNPKNKKPINNNNASNSNENKSNKKKEVKKKEKEKKEEKEKEIEMEDKDKV